MAKPIDITKISFQKPELAVIRRCDVSKLTEKVDVSALKKKLLKIVRNSEESKRQCYFAECAIAKLSGKSVSDIDYPWPNGAPTRKKSSESKKSSKKAEKTKKVSKKVAKTAKSPKKTTKVEEEVRVASVKKTKSAKGPRTIKKSKKAKK